MRCKRGCLVSGKIVPEPHITTGLHRELPEGGHVNVGIHPAQEAKERRG